MSVEEKTASLARAPRTGRRSYHHFFCVDQGECPIVGGGPGNGLTLPQVFQNCGDFKSTFGRVALGRDTVFEWES